MTHTAVIFVSARRDWIQIARVNSYKLNGGIYVIGLASPAEGSCLLLHIKLGDKYSLNDLGRASCT